MFEKENKFIFDFCYNKIIIVGSHITFEKLEALEIHPAILKFISADIDYRIFKDRQNLIQASSFDYSGKVIAKYFKLISEEIKRSRLIPENEIIEVLSNAIDFNLNFTVKPTETLINFVYQDEQPKTFEEISILLQFLFYYDYLKEIIELYFTKKLISVIPKVDMQTLLDKIDKEILASKPKELFETALDSMADFFSIGSMNQKQIPSTAFELFLKEKKLNLVFSKFQSLTSTNPKPKYDLDDMKKLLHSSFFEDESRKESSKEISDTSAAELETNLSFLGVSEELKNEIELIPKEDLISKEKLTSEGEQSESKIESSSNQIIPSTTDLTDEIKINQSVETYKLDSEQLEEIDEIKDDFIFNGKSSADILSFLSSREIEKIISSIFNEDKEDFATTIEAISDCTSYEKATEILKTLYTTYDINPYSREAILLTNAVAKYFASV